MAKPRIRAVLFDAVGTLFRSRGTIGEIYGSVASDYGFNTDPKAIDQEFIRLIRARGVPVEKHDWEKLVRSVFSNLGPFPRFDEFFEQVYELFRTEKGWRCYPETIAVLEALEAHGYLLGVVSNFDSRLDGVLDDLGIRQYFAAVVTPHSAGYAKPDGRIFLEATAALGVRPEEAIFVGDDALQDFEASAQAGLRGVLVDRQPAPSGDPDRIENLRGVLRILQISSEC